jgi:hypothetical protein
MRRPSANPTYPTRLTACRLGLNGFCGRLRDRAADCFANLPALEVGRNLGLLPLGSRPCMVGQGRIAAHQLGFLTRAGAASIFAR